jgi:beta propeller repeat protein
MATGKETRITNSYTNKVNPSIYKDRIVWEEDNIDTVQIYMFDLSTGQKLQITDNLEINTYPQIYGDYIVWLGYYDIYVYELKTKEESRITPDFVGPSWPRIYQDKIVWADMRQGNFDIYMYDLKNKQETQLTSDSGDQVSPAIYGDRVIWQQNTSFIHVADFSSVVSVEGSKMFSGWLIIVGVAVAGIVVVAVYFLHLRR